MKLQLNIFIATLLSLLCFSCGDKKQSKQNNQKNNNIIIQKYDSPPIIEDLEVEEKEHLKKFPYYKEVFYDYGNYWVSEKNKSKCLLFDNSRGKLIVFKDYKELIDKNNSENVFTFYKESENPLKIIGEFGFREGDTIMYWTYDKKNNLIIDNNSEKFIQVKVTLNKTK